MQPKIKKKLVSIIMPTYNRANLLTETVKNILSQTYKDFELIIIDDCSTDKTLNIVRELAKEDSRIKYLRNEVNMKIVKTLNKGLHEAKGTYIARADDDDPWISKTKLEKQISFLETNKEYVLVGTGAIAIDERKKELFRYSQPKHDKKIRSLMLINNPFIHGTVVFRKSILEKTGYYDENIKDAEDWDLWFRIGIKGKLYNMQTYDIYRFYGERGLSIQNRKNVSKTRLQLIKKYRKQYPHFIFAYLFNSLQYLYTFSPYLKIIDNFLFKLKRKFLAK